ncbi:MAG: hypothetical protein H0X25_16300, partial [Acidobacteriales bacterium]|nr:hypothetical protein [Terriglobales bacterium]
MAVLLAILAISPAAWTEDEGHRHELTEQQIGSVKFATSCATTVSADFNHAVALLHSFQYEQAREMFASVARKDPACAMAQWGVAMSQYHGLWDSGDLSAGRAAITQAQALAAENPDTTPRERGYILALAQVYRQDRDKAGNAQAFEQAMGSLQASY